METTGSTVSWELGLTRKGPLHDVLPTRILIRERISLRMNGLSGTVRFV